MSEQEFNEKKSVSLIQEMITVSSKNIKKDGILLLVWGCIIVLNSFFNFFPEVKLISKRLMLVFDWMKVLMATIGILFTLYYIFQSRKRVKTYIGLTARYLWVGVLVTYNMVVIITHQKTGNVDFEMLHPLQMTLIGLALFVTGGLYREKLLLLGGIIYWVAAYFAVNYALHYQWILEGSAALIGFILPGYLLYSQSRKQNV